MRLLIALFLLVTVAPTAQAQSNATILVLGDSLSAAYGMPAEAGWVALLRERLARTHGRYDVVNASITGDTTHGGLTRLPQLLAREQPAIVVLELGGNDGLRGFSLQDTKSNLRRMIQLSRQAGARVLLTGIKLPANYGPAYGDKFHRIYLDLAAEENVRLLPFLLEGVALDRSLMQADGIHPAAAAQGRLLDNVWAVLQPMLEEATVMR